MDKIKVVFKTLLVLLIIGLLILNYLMLNEIYQQLLIIKLNQSIIYQELLRQRQPSFKQMEASNGQNETRQKILS